MSELHADLPPRRRLDALAASARMGHMDMGTVLLQTCYILVDALEVYGQRLERIEEMQQAQGKLLLALTADKFPDVEQDGEA